MWKLTAFMIGWTWSAAAQQADHPPVTITLKIKNSTLQAVFRQIQQQTGTRFFCKSELLASTQKITVRFHHTPLLQVLAQLLNQRKIVWTYNEEEKTVEMKAGSSLSTLSKDTIHIVAGRVTNSAGEALAGTYVLLKGTKSGTMTNDSGDFTLNNLLPGSVLVFSHIGYERKEVPVLENEALTILKQKENQLNGMVVLGYGTTSRKLNTGSVAQIKSREIETQPVADLLQALTGRAPGLLIQQVDGNPGGASKMGIRGIGTISASGVPGTYHSSTDPLIVIDGIAFPPGNTSQSGNQEALTPGLSAFASINPADIESIAVLKDADATSIYGSRGANGVILITSKKGKAGKTITNLRSITGIDRSTYNLPLMNTAEYLDIRKRAAENDQVPVSGIERNNFDTTAYTNLRRELLEQPAYRMLAQLSLSGGTDFTKFLMSAGYLKETAMYANMPGQPVFGAGRYSFHLNLDHTSIDKKFNATFSASYGTYHNVLPGKNLALLPFMFAPNHPNLYKDGQLLWNYNGLDVSSPKALLYNQYNGRPYHLSTNLKLTRHALPGFDIITSAGYTIYQLNETVLYPQKAIAPYTTTTSSAALNNVSMNSFMIEPQLVYKKKTELLQLQAMTGGTFQRQLSSFITLYDRAFKPDDLPGFLNNVNSPNRTFTNRSSEYRYQAFFSRLTMNYDDKYILNLSGRRDGSSRFAPGKRFSCFGAAGAAWIFTVPFASFSKLRASYGTTGNDGIGDYSYLNTLKPLSADQTESGLVPASPYNNDYSWEKTTKAEVATELGFLKDRIFLTLAWYQNRTGNQLLSYRLPVQTGFTEVLQNCPAMVQNSGLELELKAVNLLLPKLKWTSSLNISINRNKLLAYDGLEQSANAEYLKIGESITATRGLHVQGVNRQTGFYEFEDRDNNKIWDKNDYVNFGDKLPSWYGGLENQVVYKNLQLTVFLEFRKQKGPDYLSLFASPAVQAKGFFNAPVAVLDDYWQGIGDDARIQKLTQSSSAAAEKVRKNFANSDGPYSDASYIRVKNIELLYQLPAKPLKLQSGSVFLQLQNMFTLTRYKGPDPENPGLTTIPPLKTIAAGIAVSF